MSNDEEDEQGGDDPTDQAPTASIPKGMVRALGKIWKRGGGVRLPPAIPFIRWYGFGSRADTFPGWFTEQMILMMILEAGDYADVRNNALRYGLTLPDIGKTPMAPEKFVRQAQDEFFFVPIEWYGEKKATQIIEQPDGSKIPEERPILQPRWIRGIPRERRWTLWADYGPLFGLLTREGRRKVRKAYSKFGFREKPDYKQIDNPWEPRVEEMYRVVNPKLKSKKGPVDNPADNPEVETEWIFANGTLQRAYTDLIALMVRGNALNNPDRWDNKLATAVDFHRNNYHSTSLNWAAEIETDRLGIPEGKSIGDKDSDKRKKRVLGLLPTFREKPYLNKLIINHGDAVDDYELTHGYRLDFNPDPNFYRDLWGTKYDHEDEARGIVSDVKRMAWVKDGKPGEFGPHSAVDLLGELPVEAWVLIGKYLRHRKLLSRHVRLYSIGDESFGALEGDTGRWMGTWVPGMAEWVLNDWKVYESYQEFWTYLLEPKNGILGRFLWCEMTNEEYRKLLTRAPTPSSWEEIAKNLVYWRFDPEECWYGPDWDEESGRMVPRLQVELLKRLITPPNIYGINLTAPNGSTVLTAFRSKNNQVEDAAKTLADLAYEGLRLTARQWNNLPSEEKDLATMVYSYYRPIETGEEENGLLWELEISQPLPPLIERVEKEKNEYRRQHKPHERTIINKELEKFPRPLIERLREPQTIHTVYYDADGIRQEADFIYDEGWLEYWYYWSDERYTDLIIVFYSEAGGTFTGVSGSRGVDYRMVRGGCEEGFGTGYGPLTEQQQRQERIYEIALKTTYYTTMKGIFDWWRVKVFAVDLTDLRSYPHRIELMEKIAAKLETRLLNWHYARMLWLRFDTLGLIPHDWAFPFEPDPASDAIEWQFVNQELMVLMGRDTFPRGFGPGNLPDVIAAQPPEVVEFGKQILTHNNARFRRLRLGKLFAIDGFTEA